MSNVFDFLCVILRIYCIYEVAVIIQCTYIVGKYKMHQYSSRKREENLIRYSIFWMFFKLVQRYFIFACKIRILYVLLLLLQLDGCSVVVTVVRWFFHFNISVDFGIMMLLFVCNSYNSFQAIKYCVDFSFIQFLGLLNISLYNDTLAGFGQLYSDN